MKRILKLMARLYPVGWRRRYGAEYQALLEDAQPHTSDVFDVFLGAAKMRMASRSFVKLVLPCALAGAVAAWAMSFARPVLYLSQTLVAVDGPDQRSIDTTLVRDTQETLTSSFLMAIIERENLYPAERSKMLEMKKDIYIRPLQRSGANSIAGFVLQFVYPDAHVAQRVDADLVSEFTAVNLRAAIANPSVASHHITFTVRKAADLPQGPFLPKRGKFGAVGLLAGFAVGFILVTVLARSRSDLLCPES